MTDEFVDERIVRVGMDEQDLVRGSNNVISALDKLTGALENASEQENDFGTTKEGLEKLASAAEAAQMKFVAMATVVSNVVNSAFNSLTSAIDHVTTRLGFDNLNVMGQWDEGLSKYEDKMTSVKTIMNATGDSIDVVNEKLEALMKYSDETSYDFATMTNAIAKFASYGVDLDTSVTAIEGVANWAASAGQDKNQAEMVLNSVGKAMGQGYMSAMYWQTVERANMATEAFKQTVLDTAVAMGKMKKVGDEYFMIGSQYTDVLGDTKASKEGVTTMNFRSMLGKKFLDKDIMVKVTEMYGKYSSAMIEYSEQTDLTVSQLMAAVRKYNKHKRTTDIPKYVFEAVGDYNQTIEMMHNLADGMKGMTKTEFDLSKLAFESAQEARTLKMAVESISDASSSLWSMAFEDIFGNEVEGTAFWTDVANNLYDLLVEPMWNAEEALSKGFESGSKLYTNLITDNTFSTEKWEYLLNEIGGTKFKTVVEEAGSISEAFGDPETAQTVLDAYEDIFTIARRIVDYKTEFGTVGDAEATKWLDDLNSKIQKSTKLTKEQKAELKFTYDDLQSIVDLVGTEDDFNAGKLTEEIELLYKYAESAKEVSSPRQQFYDTINGAIETLDSYEWAGLEALDEALGINAESIGDKIRSIIDWFDRLNEAIGVELDGDRYNTIKETFSNILETFKTLGDTAGTFFGPLGEFISSLTDLDKISENFDKLLNTLKNVSETISIVTDKLANGFIIPGIEGIRAKLEDAFSPLTNLKDSVKTVFEIEGVDENWLGDTGQHILDLLSQRDGSFGSLADDLEKLQNGISASSEMVGEYVSMLSSVFDNNTVSSAVDNLGKIIKEAGSSLAGLGDLGKTVQEVLDYYNLEPSFFYDTLKNGFDSLFGDADAKEEFQYDLGILKEMLGVVKSINEVIKENNKERFDNFVNDLNPGPLKSILESLQTLSGLISPITDHIKELKENISQLLDYYNLDAGELLFDTLQNGIKGLFGDDDAKEEFRYDLGVLQEMLDIIRSINDVLKENAKEKFNSFVEDLDPGPLKSFLTTIQKIADWFELLKLQIDYVKGDFSFFGGLKDVWAAFKDLWSGGLTNGHFDESKLNMFRLTVDLFKTGLDGVRDRLFEQLPEDSWIIKVYNAFQAIKSFLGDIIHNVAKFLFPKLTRELDSYEDLGGKIGVIAEKIKQGVDTIKKVFDGLFNSKLFNIDLKSMFGNMFKGGADKDFVSPLNSVLNVLAVAGGAIGSFVGIKKLLDWKKNLKEDNTPILDGVSDMFEGLSDDVEKIKESAESIEKAEGVGTKAADVVLKIAGSFLAIAGGMYLIGKIDENKMGSVFKAFSMIAGYLVSALAVVMYFKTEMAKINPDAMETKDSYSLGVTILAIAASAWIIVDAIKRVNDLVKEDPESAEKSLDYVIKIFKKIASKAFLLSFDIKRITKAAGKSDGDNAAIAAYSLAATFLALGLAVAAIVKAMGSVPSENLSEGKINLILKLIKRLRKSFVISLAIKRIVKAGSEISKSDSDSIAAISFSLAGTFVALGLAVSTILTALSFTNTDKLTDENIDAISKILKALKKSIFWISLAISSMIKSAAKGDFNTDQMKMIAVFIAEAVGGVAVAIELIVGAIASLAALKDTGLDMESSMDDIVKLIKTIKGVVIAVTVLFFSASLFSAIEGFTRLTKIFGQLKNFVAKFGLNLSSTSNLGFTDAITKLSWFLLAIGGTMKLISWAVSDMNEILDEYGGKNLAISLLAILAPITFIFGAVMMAMRVIGDVFNGGIVEAGANSIGKFLGFSKTRSLSSDAIKALRATLVMFAEFAIMIFEIGRTYERILFASNGDINQIINATISLIAPLATVIIGVWGILGSMKTFQGTSGATQVRQQTKAFRNIEAILAEFVVGIYIIGEAVSSIVAVAHENNGIEKIKEARNAIMMLEGLAALVTAGLMYIGEYTATSSFSLSGSFGAVIGSYAAAIASIVILANTIKPLAEVDPTNLGKATDILWSLEVLAGVVTVVLTAMSAGWGTKSFNLAPIGFFAVAIASIVIVASSLKKLAASAPDPAALGRIALSVGGLEAIAVAVATLLTLVSKLKIQSGTSALVAGGFFAEAIAGFTLIAEALSDMLSAPNFNANDVGAIVHYLTEFEFIMGLLGAVLVAISAVAGAFPQAGGVALGIIAGLTVQVVAIAHNLGKAMDSLSKVADFAVQYAELSKTINEQDLKAGARDFGRTAIETFAEAVGSIAENIPDMEGPMFAIGQKLGQSVAGIGLGMAGFFTDNTDTFTAAVLAIVSSIEKAIADNSDAIYNAFDALGFMLEGALSRAILRISLNNEGMGRMLALISGYGGDFDRFIEDLEAKSETKADLAAEAARRAKLQSVASLMDVLTTETDIRNIITDLNAENIDDAFLSPERIQTLTEAAETGTKGMLRVAESWGITVDQAKALYEDYTTFLAEPPEGFEATAESYAKYVEGVSSLASLANGSLEGLVGKLKSTVVDQVQPILSSLIDSGIVSGELADTINGALDSLTTDADGTIVEPEVEVKPKVTVDWSKVDEEGNQISEKTAEALAGDKEAREAVEPVVEVKPEFRLKSEESAWKAAHASTPLGKMFWNSVAGKQEENELEIAAAANLALEAGQIKIDDFREAFNSGWSTGTLEDIFKSNGLDLEFYDTGAWLSQQMANGVSEESILSGTAAGNAGATSTLNGFKEVSDESSAEYGSMLAYGLAQGATAEGPQAALANAGRALADIINRAFTAKEEIKSPSRLYKKFGAYLVEGLVNGVDDNLSSVELAGRYMADAINAGFNFGEIVESIGAAEISDEIKMIADEMDYGAESFKSMMGTYAQLFGDDFTAEKGKTVFDSWINSIYEASDEFGELEKDLDELLEEEAKLYEEGARRFGSLWDAYDTEFLEEQYEEYQDIMDDYDRDYNWRLEELQQIKRDLEASDSDTKGVDAEISTLQRERSNYEYQLKLTYKDIIDLNKFAVGEYKKVTDSIEDKQEEILKKQEEIFKNLTDNIKDAFDSYSKAWNSMNLATSSNMFEKLEVTPSKTFGQMMAGLRSQSVERQKWLDNLSKLEELGYNKEIINYFKNAGVERAAEVSVLARASEAQVEEMNGLYANLNDTLENETAMKWAYTNDRLDEIVQLGKAMLFAGYSGEDISEMISDYGIDAAAYMKALLGYSSDNQEIAKSYSDTMKNTTKDMANELMGTAIAAYGDEAGVLAKMFDTAKIADVIRPSTEKAIKAAAGIRESSNVTSIAENHETNYNIIQNNYSPDPLDETDIYRRTRNLMSSISTRV